MSCSDEAKKLRIVEEKIAALESKPEYIATKAKDDALEELEERDNMLLAQHLRYTQEAALHRNNIRAAKQDIELAGIAEQVAASRANGKTADLPGSGIASNWIRTGDTKVDESCANQYNFTNKVYKNFSDANNALEDAARYRDGEDLAPGIERALEAAQEAIIEGTKLCQNQAKMISVAFEHGWAVAKTFGASINGESSHSACTSEESKFLTEAIKLNETKKAEAKRKQEPKEKELKQAPAVKTRNYGPYGYSPYGNGAGYPPPRNAPYGAQRTPFYGMCYKCGQQGHRASECPNAQADGYPALPAPPPPRAPGQ